MAAKLAALTPQSTTRKFSPNPKVWLGTIGRASNHEQARAKRIALPGEISRIGGQHRVRTCDPRRVKAVLYH